MEPVIIAVRIFVIVESDPSNLGWTKDGYKRFNALHTMVKHDGMQRVEFEARLKERLEEDNANSNRGGDSLDEEEEEEIIPANDFVGVRQPMVEEKRHNDSSDDEDEQQEGF